MSADIDIDFADRNLALYFLKHIPARLESNDQARPHASGIYVTDIPYDAVLKCASIDYKEAELRGYFKLDFLNMSVYQLISDYDHYDKMLAKETNWTRLWTDSAWASSLVHIGNYTELLKSMQPDSLLKMAAFISIIRPGKAHLQNKSWDQVFDTVWDGDSTQGFVFKKSHAISYAQLVVLHMNLTD